MRHSITLYFLLLAPALSSFAATYILPVSQGDSIEHQILFNGRLWKTSAYNATGSPYLGSNNFVAGSLTTGKYNFRSLKLRYDIFNDELLILKADGLVIVLNNELIDIFSLKFDNEVLKFVNFNDTSDAGHRGYMNLLFDSEIKLFVKYSRIIISTNMTGGVPEFKDNNAVLIFKDGVYHTIEKRRDFLSLFNDQERKLLTRFIRENYITLSRNDPESYRRVLEYYNMIPG